MVDLTQTPKQLKQSILMEAMQGKLTKQLPSDGNAENLLKSINQIKQSLIRSKKIRRHNISPIQEKPFSIPGTWKFQRLYDVSNLTTGFSFKKKMYVKSGTRVIRISDFDEHGFINKKPAYIQYNDKFARFLLRSGDILMAMTGGTVGKTSPVLNINNKFLLNQRVARFRTIKILPKFLDYYLQTPYIINKINSSKNSTNDNISMTFLNKLCVPVPPLAEQKRIVQRLDQILPKIDELNKDVVRLHSIRKAFPHRLKQSLLMEAMQGKLTKQLPSDGNADELLQKIQQKKQALIKAGKIRRHKKLPPISKDEIPSNFNIPKSWKWVRLGNISEINTGNTPSKSNKKYYSSNDIPFVTPADLHNSFVNNTRRFLASCAYKKARIAVKSSIFIVGIGGSIGKTGIATETSAFNQQIHNIYSVSVNLSYIYYYLQSMLVKDQLKVTSGTATPIVNKTKLSSFIFPLPPLVEQKQIVNFLQQLFSLI